MSDEVKNTISLNEFEANGAKFNLKGIKRSYFDSLKHLDEYKDSKLIDKADYETIVLEAVIDKSGIDSFIKLLNDNNFEIYNDKDMPFLLNIKNRLLTYPKTTKTLKDLNSIEKTINDIANKELYTVNKEDDATIYFVPFNNKVNNIHDFFKVYREIFYNFALENDLTIIFRTKDRKNKTNGFFAFNFLDTNEDKQIVSYKYAVRVVINTKTNNSTEYIEECMMINAIGKNKEELDEVNTVITKE